MDRRQHERQRNERYVHRHQVDWRAVRPHEIIQAHVPDVRPFPQDHAGIGPEPGVKLAVPDIDRVDPCRSVLKKTIREPARRRSDIHGDAPLDGDRKGRKDRRELDSPRLTYG